MNCYKPLAALSAKILVVLGLLCLGALGQVRAQEKYSLGYNKLSSIDSTDMVVASQEAYSKWTAGFPDMVSLLFVNTKTGQSKLLELPPGYVINNTNFNVPARYQGERLVVLRGKNKDWNKKAKLEWEDPNVLFIVTASGQHLKQVSPGGESLVEWTVNKQTGAILFITRPDSNQDNKFDFKDESKVYLYHLASGELTFVSKTTVGATP
ncbi:hypothetical protein [Rufibacter psychrotolerans]|uniref:hypothetical protein n=1 Tax=Rufibacter psychrotolerans TaxID=2812556 RepID=UPI001967D709|nr:hypothetical protein [Rufibacter sp. SYSU D00308]